MSLTLQFSVLELVGLLKVLRDEVYFSFWVGFNIFLVLWEGSYQS